MTYSDDDGDQVAVTTDDSLEEALVQASFSSSTGERRINLTAVCADGSVGVMLSRAGGSKVENMSAVASFLGGLIAASSVAASGLLLVAKSR